MIAPIRLAVSTLAAASVLAGGAAPLLAQQFYNPWQYHHTRQALTNRAITKRMGRKPTSKQVKTTGKRKAQAATTTKSTKPSK